MVGRLACLAMLLASVTAGAETTILTLADGGHISFDAPSMTKVKEVRDAQRYEYLATSQGKEDERFNLSVYVEHTDCHFGSSTKEITRCFLEKSDSIPGLVPESRNTACLEKYCNVVYGVAGRIKDREFRQLHVNLLFAYRDGWAHVHLSILNPTDDDIPILTKLPTSLSYE
jgi:hypothetical protein